MYAWLNSKIYILVIYNDKILVDWLIIISLKPIMQLWLFLFPISIPVFSFRTQYAIIQWQCFYWLLKYTDNFRLFFVSLLRLITMLLGFQSSWYRWYEYRFFWVLPSCWFGFLLSSNTSGLADRGMVTLFWLFYWPLPIVSIKMEHFLGPLNQLAHFHKYIFPSVLSYC